MQERKKLGEDTKWRSGSSGRKIENGQGRNGGVRSGGDGRRGRRDIRERGRRGYEGRQRNIPRARSSRQYSTAGSSRVRGFVKMLLLVADAAEVRQLRVSAAKSRGEREGRATSRAEQRGWVAGEGTKRVEKRKRKEGRGKTSGKTGREQCSAPVASACASMRSRVAAVLIAVRKAEMQCETEAKLHWSLGGRGLSSRSGGSSAAQRIVNMGGLRLGRKQGMTEWGAGRNDCVGEEFDNTHPERVNLLLQRRCMYPSPYCPFQATAAAHFALPVPCARLPLRAVEGQQQLQKQLRAGNRANAGTPPDDGDGSCEGYEYRSESHPQSSRCHGVLQRRTWVELRAWVVFVLLWAIEPPTVTQIPSERGATRCSSCARRTGDWRIKRRNAGARERRRGKARSAAPGEDDDSPAGTPRISPPPLPGEHKALRVEGRERVSNVMILTSARPSVGYMRRRGSRRREVFDTRYDSEEKKWTILNHVSPVNAESRPNRHILRLGVDHQSVANAFKSDFILAITIPFVSKPLSAVGIVECRYRLPHYWASYFCSFLLPPYLLLPASRARLRLVTDERRFYSSFPTLLVNAYTYVHPHAYAYSVVASAPVADTESRGEGGDGGRCFFSGGMVPDFLTSALYHSHSEDIADLVPQSLTAFFPLVADLVLDVSATLWFTAVFRPNAELDDILVAA
ncbi:hypothetical protein B0H12DRAFT_1067204 [Mycena haematopus]|nr:hypothetical protein B0H12DRAFT_1067204 [Mycena haematopus]